MVVLSLTSYVNWNFQKRLLVIILFTMFAGNMEKAPSCDVRVHAYKNGKTMEQCREEARKNTEILSDKILKKGEVSWTRILEVADHDELVYRSYMRNNSHDGY
jgi:hypothetical protein